MPERSLRARGHGAGAAALLVVVLAACGGGGDESTAGSTAAAGTTSTAPAATQPSPQGAAPGTDQLLITESIDAVFVSADPAKACEQDVTDAYVERAFGDVEGCRSAQVPAAAASSVDVGAVRVSGERASADVVPHGGPSDGETVHVTLVYEDGAWRVDSLKSDVPVGP